VTFNMREIGSLAGHGSGVLSVAISPGGDLLASASRDRTVRLWALPEGDEVATLRGHRGPVHAVVFSPTGTRLASAGGDMQARLWAVPDGELLLNLTGHHGAVETMAFEPDGLQLACGWNMWSYGHITLWDLVIGEQVAVLRADHGQLVFGVACAPGGLLAAALAGGFIRVWKRQVETATIRGHGEAVRAVAFSPNWKLLASASADGMVKLWALPEGTPVATLKGQSGAAHCVAWSPDGKLIAAGYSDGTIRLWDVAARREVASLTAREGAVRSVVWDDLGELIAAASGGSIGLWAVDR
jgi:WD40 repeat protein